MPLFSYFLQLKKSKKELKLRETKRGKHNRNPDQNYREQTFPPHIALLWDVLDYLIR